MSQQEDHEDYGRCPFCGSPFGCGNKVSLDRPVRRVVLPPPLRQAQLAALGRIERLKRVERVRKVLHNQHGAT